MYDGGNHNQYESAAEDSTCLRCSEMWLVSNFRPTIQLATGSSRARASLTNWPIAGQGSWFAKAVRMTSKQLSTNCWLRRISSAFCLSTSCVCRNACSRSTWSFLTFSSFFSASFSCKTLRRLENPKQRIDKQVKKM